MVAVLRYVPALELVWTPNPLNTRSDSSVWMRRNIAYSSTHTEGMSMMSGMVDARRVARCPRGDSWMLWMLYQMKSFENTGGAVLYVGKAVERGVSCHLECRRRSVMSPRVMRRRIVSKRRIL